MPPSSAANSAFRRSSAPATRTHVLHDGQEVTVSCAEGDEGFVYEGIAKFEVETLDMSDIPETKTKVMLNLGNPGAAFRWWRIPADGVGLARMEFVVSNHIRVHPMALVKFDQLKDEAARKEIAEITAGYDDKTEYFVEHLARGLARIAAALYPKPVIVRMSDFKTNEYAGLIGGAEFEPKEENPMIGFRGASRYYSPRYKEGFALECKAMRRLRNEMGFDNVVMMIPFCRSVDEADKVLAVMAENGLKRGKDGLAGLCDVRDSVERHPRQAVRRAFRRLLDRLQRPHSAHPWRRPRFRRSRRPVRRAGRGGGMDDRQRHRGGAQGRRQGRPLRPGAERPSALRRVPGQVRHRLDFGQP